MKIPDLPTDNLYKFLSLSGILIVLFCIVYPAYLVRQLEDLLNDNATSMGVMELESEYLNAKGEELLESTKKIQENLQKYDYEKDLGTLISLKKIKEGLHDEKQRDYLKFIFQYRDEIFPEFKEFKEINKQLSEYKELGNQIKINTFKIKRKNEINSKLAADIETIFKLSLFGQVLGMLTMFGGFYWWYTKVQKLLDEKIRLEVKEKD